MAQISCSLQIDASGDADAQEEGGEESRGFFNFTLETKVWEVEIGASN